jgi:hypothetical protein
MRSKSITIWVMVIVILLAGNCAADDSIVGTWNETGESVPGKVMISAADADDTPQYIDLSATDMFPDLNGDWMIDCEDFGTFSAFWMNQSCSDPNWCMGSDFNASGEVDYEDLLILCNYWLTKIADPYLVAHWSLDDNAENTFVTDISGNNHNGTATANTSVLSAPGQVNTCFDFSGADAVQIDDNDALSFVTDDDDAAFSITAWVYATTPETVVTDVNEIPQVIISKWDFDTQEKEWLLVIRSDGTLSLQLVDDNNSGVIKAKTSAALSEGWRFVAATYDATKVGLGISLYVDGVNVPQIPSNGSYIRMRNTTADVYIGARTYGGINDYFADKIDDVRLFSKCLTAAEISELY